MTIIRTYTAQGIDILIDTSDEHVFQPHPITFMLANAIEVKPTDVVLEVCSGSGLVAITAAKLGASKVFASDIAQPAVHATRWNAELNGINGQMSVVKGDFFGPFRGKHFDVIVANPPCMPVPDGAIYRNAGITLAVNSGHDGSEVMKRFLTEARHYLKPTANLYFPLPKWCNWRAVQSVLDSYYRHETVLQASVPYYLADFSPQFADHIDSLIDRRLADCEMDSDRPITQVMIKKAVLLS